MIKNKLNNKNKLKKENLRHFLCNVIRSIIHSLKIDENIKLIIQNKNRFNSGNQKLLN